MPFIAIATLVVVAMSAGHIHPFDQVLGPGYSMVATHGAYGIIINERFAARFPGEPGETWTPTREDVAKAETLFLEYRPYDAVTAESRAEADSPENLVSRTWYGGIVDGQRIMYVNGYCFGGQPEHPLVPVLVMDGGSCFWKSAISAGTWEIIRYVENGEA